jgi:glycosyltransferase involved in cell wall biosynthesis
MKRLGIDLRCLPASGDEGSGIAHAARAVARELCAELGERAVVYQREGARGMGGRAAGRPGGQKSGDSVIVLLKDGSRQSLVNAIRDVPCDVLFVPSGAVSPLLPVPAIPWVHDVDIFLHPEWFPQSWLKRFMTTRMFLHGVRSAPRVFAASSYTHDALVKLVPGIRDRVTVTGEGGDGVLAKMTDEERERERLAARARLTPSGIKRPFVLMLGTVEPRKNIPLICDIWPEVAARVPETDLIIAGRDGWGMKAITSFLERCRARLTHSGSSLIRLTDVNDALRRDLLMAASVVAVPSWSEGFGLVALEAAQAGTPVLASDRGALPEVLGKGEWLIDPSDANAWCDALAHLLKDESYRDNICQIQAHQRSVWSWEKTGKIIADEVAKFIY